MDVGMCDCVCVCVFVCVRGRVMCLLCDLWVHVFIVFKSKTSSVNGFIDACGR